MSKKQRMAVQTETVRVWHPGYQAEANPRREDLQAWIEQGWQVQTSTEDKE